MARKGTDPTAVCTLMSVRIMAAVRDGERDPERLKELVLQVIDYGGGHCTLSSASDSHNTFENRY